MVFANFPFITGAKLNALFSKFSDLNYLINRKVTEKSIGIIITWALYKLSTFFITNSKHLLNACCVWGIVLSRCKRVSCSVWKEGFMGEQKVFPVWVRTMGWGRWIVEKGEALTEMFIFLKTLPIWCFVTCNKVNML